MGGFVKEVPPKTYDILISGLDMCTAPHTADHSECGIMQLAVVTLQTTPSVGSCRWL